MEQTLDNLTEAIRDELMTLPEVKRIYDYVPDSVNELPAVIVSATGGRCGLASHGREDGSSPLMCQHMIRIELHVPRKDLEREMRLLTSLASTLLVWLYGGFVRDRFQGTMVTPGDPRTANNATAPLDYDIGPSEWGDQKTLALLCDFMVTTEQEIAP